MDFDYNRDKDAWVKINRGFGFERIIDVIEEGNVIQNLKNPSSKYKNQRIYVIKIDNYVFIVPYVFDKIRKIKFLKTFWPSRKFTNKYVKKN